VLARKNGPCRQRVLARVEDALENETNISGHGAAFAGRCLGISLSCGSPTATPGASLCGIYLGN